MRSQVLLRRSRSLFRTSTVLSPALSHRPARSLPKSRRLPTRTYANRLLSPDNSSPDPPPTPSEQDNDPNDDSPVLTSPGASSPPEEPDKPKTKRSTKSSTPITKDKETLDLPEGLDILWSPNADSPRGDSSDSSSLPPPEIFDEALHHLRVTLHPHIQHSAAYPPPLTSVVEPTLALYCPMEGGDYIIDATVQELARRTGAEVLVLDAVQLAAGEWGAFGPAANTLKLPRNPLHFTTPAPTSPPPASSSADEEDDGFMYPPAQQMLLTVLAPSRTGSSTVISSSKRSTSPNRIRVFFDSLVNLPSKIEDSETSAPKSPPKSPRPRLVYIRDYPTLASTSSTWYPHLLSAVSQRRKGALSRPTSPVSHPMTIVFGITPSLTPPSESSSSQGGSPLLNLLMDRAAVSSQSASGPKHGKLDWSESPAAEKARERRLQQRLKIWEKGDNVLMEELPRQHSSSESSEDSGTRRSDGIIIVGSSLNSLLTPPRLHSSPSSPDSDVPSFFRTSVLVPSVRSSSDERDCRVARRREINELTMRMAVGAVGGVLDKERAETGLPAQPSSESQSGSPDDEASEPPILSEHEQMWDDWGRHIETWANVRRIADRALGGAMTAYSGQAALDPTPIPWSEVHRAWATVRGAADIRKAWLKDVLPSPRTKSENEEDAEEPERLDEVIERVKNDPDLDAHEQKLLPSIVDAATMPTSFSQVHLPPHTIDSVRSIVSLPLLHPQAFQHGILKQYGMTGCLLFGPPGTGKTLVVRALAKEAGCRMMVISPSDVMDMYVGEGEKLVRAVFSLARKLSPCVIFLDEIDALFGARMSARESGGAIAHRGVITEFMQEMDGLKSSRDDNVIVIGATNRPFDLDDAVLRRLPRRLLVDLPGVKEREEILKILLRDEKLASDVDLHRLAKRTESFSGSDLKHLCVSAALDAVKEHVKLPWVTSPERLETAHDTSTSDNTSDTQVGAEKQTVNQSAVMDAGTDVPVILTKPKAESLRTIHPHNFDKALKEIIPSSSESLGSLAELRKWNEEFGEGRKDRPRLIWGKGRFGFNFNDRGTLENGQAVPASAGS